MSTEDTLRRFNLIYGANAPRLQELGALSPLLAEQGLEFVVGKLYGDESLDMKTRELCIISCLAAQGGLPNELRVHLEIALRLGASKRELVAVIETVSAFAGLPRAVGALSVAVEVFRAWDAAHPEVQNS